MFLYWRRAGLPMNGCDGWGIAGSCPTLDLPGSPVHHRALCAATAWHGMASLLLLLLLLLTKCPCCTQPYVRARTELWAARQADGLTD
ncbi:hypothetical protein ACOMHN_048461 [Nucella lapillus]